MSERIVFAALWLFCGVIALGFTGVLLDQWARTEEVLGVLFPLVTLILGFTIGYFMAGNDD